MTRPTSTKTTDPESVTVADPRAPKSLDGFYRVVRDGVILRVGAKREEASRFMRGARVELTSKLHDIPGLLRDRVVVADGEPLPPRITPRQAMQLAGAPDDPVRVPDAEVLTPDTTDLADA